MRIVTIEKKGNFGNQVIQYLAAITIAHQLGDGEIRGFELPALGIFHAPIPQNLIFDVTIRIERPFEFNVTTVAWESRNFEHVLVVVADYVQNIKNFLDVGFYRAIFKLDTEGLPAFDERHLLINIRTNEILTGRFDSYCLVPIAFYQLIVSESGLIPVFVGQILDCEYVDLLKKTFPEATFVLSRGAKFDFDLLRSAKNIIVSVSTFSWLAAWLSSASNIFIPLLGFYSPCFFRHVDLLPTDDPRYHYYWFPLMISLPEKLAIQHHDKIMGRVKRISTLQLDCLKSVTPLIPPLHSPDITDGVWYVHTYLEAACEIADGWFSDPNHHYRIVGKARGYLPAPRLLIEAPPFYENIALCKPANQSSVDVKFSIQAPEIEAGKAVDGIISKSQGFRTLNEANPWWTVDLINLYRIHEIRVYNCLGSWQDRVQAAPLRIDSSCDLIEWHPLLISTYNDVFGADIGPLKYTDSEGVVSRGIRIILPSGGVLQLVQVEVFGTLENVPKVSCVERSDDVHSN